MPGSPPDLVTPPKAAPSRRAAPRSWTSAATKTPPPHGPRAAAATACWLYERNA